MSDIGPPRKEPPPSELRIGAPPHPVTRLSRRTLVVATALVTALVFAALWYALGIRPLRFAGGPELYNTNAKPTDALANMRDSYADLTRPKPAPSLPQPVPQLGPPLPGDLGRPMLQQQTGAPTPAADPEAERQPVRAGTSGRFRGVLHGLGKAGCRCRGSSRSRSGRWRFNAVAGGNCVADVGR
jgi:type IV secretion system protein TrbI